MRAGLSKKHSAELCNINAQGLEIERINPLRKCLWYPLRLNDPVRKNSVRGKTGKAVRE
jgi:hypothetical protein